MHVCNTKSPATFSSAVLQSFRGGVNMESARKVITRMANISCDKCVVCFVFLPKPHTTYKDWLPAFAMCLGLIFWQMCKGWSPCHVRETGSGLVLILRTFLCLHTGREMTIDMFRESWHALSSEISDRLRSECSAGVSNAVMNTRLACAFCTSGKVRCLRIGVMHACDTILICSNERGVYAEGRTKLLICMGLLFISLTD